MFMWLNGSGPHRVDKMELFSLDDIVIKVYEFVLRWPLWVLKKIRIDLQRERLQQHVDFKMLETPFLLTACI